MTEREALAEAAIQLAALAAEMGRGETRTADQLSAAVRPALVLIGNALVAAYAAEGDLE